MDGSAGHQSRPPARPRRSLHSPVRQRTTEPPSPTSTSAIGHRSIATFARGRRPAAGLTAREMGGVLGISEAAAQKQVERGLRVLKEAYGAD